jgi:hypothetical protein
VLLKRFSGKSDLNLERVSLGMLDSEGIGSELLELT